MKRILLLLAFLAGAAGVPAQESAGDLYDGLTRKLPFSRMIPPYGLEVTYDKTVHILFPAAIRYVDLGSQNLIAGKADGAENVLRVKAAVRDFEAETNLAVITEDGNFYTFNVKYAAEPRLLNIEMQDLLRDSSEAAPDNTLEVQLGELGGESPRLVSRIIRHIHRMNDRSLRHIDDRALGMRCTLRGLYTCGGLLYFHLQLRNTSSVPFDVDFITFKIVDRKIARRTAIQERTLQPLKIHNPATRIAARGQERMVLALGTFMIPDDKQLLVSVHEKGGGRHLTLTIRNGDLQRAKVIDTLKIR